MNQESRTIKSFTDLKAWQEAHRFVLMTYKMARKFPKEELFGLTSQLRRAVISISSNIAEGFSRQSYADKIRFYAIAQGSTTETQNQLLVARDVGYINQQEFKPLADQSVTVHKLVNGLIKGAKKIKLLDS